MRVVFGNTDITTGDKNQLAETLAEHPDGVGFGSAIAIVSTRDCQGIPAA